MTKQTSITSTSESGLTRLQLAGLAANRVAARHVFDEYRAGKSANTLRNQDRNLSLFAEFLIIAEASPQGDLNADPEAWSGITWGLVEAFKQYMLKQGYAITSVNNALSSIKAYAKLAAKAEALDIAEYMRIKAVEGYSRKQAKRVNEKRDTTRRAATKKAEFLVIGKTTRDRLRRMESDGGLHPDTPQGRRDCLLWCILLDLGLRVGELAGLTVGNVNLETGHLTFYRPKVDTVQTHELKPDVLKAMRRYFQYDAPADQDAPLLRDSKKTGDLLAGSMSERAINKRVKHYGKLIALETLSPHDARHTWATVAARQGTPLDALMYAGGWNSYAMPLRYIKAAEIANQGVLID